MQAAIHGAMQAAKQAEETKSSLKQAEVQISRLTATAEVANHEFAALSDSIAETAQNVPKHHSTVSHLKTSAHAATATLSGVVIHGQDQELTLELATWKQTAAEEGELSPSNHETTSS